MPAYVDTKVWDPVNGSDSNSGNSRSQAWRTPGGTAPAAWLAASIENRRAILLNGIFSPTNSSDFASYAFWSFTQNGLHIAPDGDNAVRIYGDAVLAQTFTHTSGGVWTATLPTGLSIGAAFLDHRNVTYSGLNGRQLRGGLLESDASATPALNKWNYNSGTGVFAVNTGSGSNDPNGRVSICRSGNFNLITVQGNGCVIEGIELSISGPLSSASYGIQLRGTGHLAQDLISHISGYHPLGASGSQCEGNIFKNCIGGTGGPNATTFVLHASSGNVSGKILDGEAHACGHFTPAGTVHSGHVGNTAIYMHTGGSNPVTDMEIRGIRCYVYSATDNGINVLGGSTELTAYTGARTAADNRALRFIDVRTFNDTWMYVNGAPLFQRCRLDYSKSGPLGTGVSYGTIRIKGSGGTGCPSQPLFDACEILANLDNASSSIGIMQGWNTTVLQAGEGPTLVNTTMLDTGSGSNQAGLILPNFANFRAEVYSSVLGFSGGKTTGRLLKSDTGTTHAFAGNVYAAIASYSDVTSRDTSSEWTSAIDPQAIHVATAADLALVSGSTSGVPRPHSPVHRRRSRTIKSRADINQSRITGSAGCYQLVERWQSRFSH